MGRSTIVFLSVFSFALTFGGVGVGLSGLAALVSYAKTRPLSGTGIACWVVLMGLIYLWIRGFSCLLVSVRWVAHNWKYSRREDLARRGLLMGWLPALTSGSQSGRA